ncbi:methionine/alanine import family NSS transporter small subunit [uncultured Propionibacterium sp.]|nr:methionine/alanine import family NSS transporter small subunit [uncultured Propionibacterium sp.]
MTGIAVLIMVGSIVIIWGGLGASVIALVRRGRRED